LRVTVSVGRPTAITDLIVTRAVSAIAELLLTIQFNSIYFSSRLIVHGKNVQYRMIKNN